MLVKRVVSLDTKTRECSSKRDKNKNNKLFKSIYLIAFNTPHSVSNLLASVAVGRNIEILSYSIFASNRLLKSGKSFKYQHINLL